MNIYNILDAIAISALVALFFWLKSKRRQRAKRQSFEEHYQEILMSDKYKVRGRFEQ